ncbi:4-hydroxy-2-oxoglutarate aldolase, mitochondrial-like [Penaeus chinensis]|uniref:4-hydroxy-2-oxoglutarate aldolase, mitochondrial-like n=1 Tax=Penaeus chinensis TaxID=139456 RepID=UPI001FB8526C|nr:4-hydroxy-2-oxoglutarate aldolase, mitochondrial-like [Penaeus chinensis]XP_047488184.1 4-hydroxy-2-oxoglutarate aldolase, mitochondrial-like [Penaeus chinensis]
MAYIAKGLTTRICQLTSLRVCQRCPLSLSVLRGTTVTPSKAVDLSGVFPPMPTPFNPNESVNYDKFASNIEAWNKVPFKGLVVQGSNGEYVYLSTEERIDLVKCVRDSLPRDSGKIILAGSGCESTKATIEMSEKMAQAGADAVMVVTPSYYKPGMKDKALHSHFTAVADNSPVPVILYSVPAFTVIDLSLDVIVDLAQHPNIIGIKESGGDISKIGAMVHRTRSCDFQIVAGSASFFLSCLQIGGVGAVAALANVLGPAVCDLHRLALAGNMEAAVPLQQKLIGPNAAVTKGFGIPGLKQVMDWMGLYGGPTRSPLQSLSEQDTVMLRKIFVDAGYL